MSHRSRYHSSERQRPRNRHYHYESRKKSRDHRDEDTPHHRYYPDPYENRRISRDEDTSHMRHYHRTRKHSDRQMHRQSDCDHARRSRHRHHRDREIRSRDTSRDRSRERSRERSRDRESGKYRRNDSHRNVRNDNKPHQHMTFRDIIGDGNKCNNSNCNNKTYYINEHQHKNTNNLFQKLATKIYKHEHYNPILFQIYLHTVQMNLYQYFVTKNGLLSALQAINGKKSEFLIFIVNQYKYKILSYGLINKLFERVCEIDMNDAKEIMGKVRKWTNAEMSEGWTAKITDTKQQMLIFAILDGLNGGQVELMKQAFCLKQAKRIRDVSENDLLHVLENQNQKQVTFDELIQVRKHIERYQKIFKLL
eukprot:91708_1